MKKNKIYIVGMGPGEQSMMTGSALAALKEAEVIVGYAVYIDLLKGSFPEKEMLSTPMKQEENRCRLCFEKAREGKKYAAGMQEFMDLLRLCLRWAGNIRRLNWR